VEVIHTDACHKYHPNSYSITTLHLPYIITVYLVRQGYKPQIVTTSMTTWVLAFIQVSTLEVTYIGKYEVLRFDHLYGRALELGIHGLPALNTPLNFKNF